MRMYLKGKMGKGVKMILWKRERTECFDFKVGLKMCQKEWNWGLKTSDDNRERMEQNEGWKVKTNKVMGKKEERTSKSIFIKFFWGLRFKNRCWIDSLSSISFTLFVFLSAFTFLPILSRFPVWSSIALHFSIFHELVTRFMDQDGFSFNFDSASINFWSKSCLSTTNKFTYTFNAFNIFRWKRIVFTSASSLGHHLFRFPHIW